jgi:hypothetical protein
VGTDRDTVFEGVCRCGSGSIRINHCEVDHGWPTATPVWYESSIHCRQCSATYEIERRGREFLLLKKNDLADIERWKTAASTRAEEIRSEPLVHTALAQFADLLTRQPSKVAIHHLLRDAGWEYSSIGTFRKHWKNAEAWIAQNIKSRDLPKVFATVQAPTGMLTDWLAELTALDERGTQRATGDGEPVFRL